jgi:hypothetical protein
MGRSQTPEPTTRYIVAWRSGQWVIYCQSGSLFHSVHDTREAAIWEGRRHAAKNRPSVLSVRNQEGSVEAEYLYH